MADYCTNESLPEAQRSTRLSRPNVTCRARGSAFILVRVCLGTLLVATATLKAMDSFGATRQRSAAFAPLIVFVAVQTELLLGLWLLSGLTPRWSRNAALLAFSGLAAVAAYMAILRRSSCGCAGALALSPWVALAVDALALGLLLRFPPYADPDALAQNSGSLMPASSPVRQVMVSCIVCAVCLAAAHFGSGSLGLAGAGLRGDRLAVGPHSFNVGPAAEGDKRTAVFRLTNLSDEPVSVVGAIARCGCMATRDLPVVVPPHLSTTVTVEITYLAEPVKFCRPVKFLTDSPSQSEIQVRVCGRLNRVPGSPIGRQ